MERLLFMTKPNERDENGLNSVLDDNLAAITKIYTAIFVIREPF